jgi:site-specific DNA-methyltransferase (adenine-specific)/modification methylase
MEVDSTNPEVYPMPKPKSILVEGDCLEAMSHIPAHSVNLILCDLPYGTTQNSWDSVIPLDKLWRHYRRILAPKGVVALMGQGSFTARLILSQEDMFKYKITWVKSKPTNFLNAKNSPYASMRTSASSMRNNRIILHR